MRALHRVAFVGTVPLLAEFRRRLNNHSKACRFQPGANIRDLNQAALWKVFGHTGAVAFSRTGNPATSEFRDATVLRKFGDVPDDLGEL
jgi:hypothetical protein